MSIINLETFKNEQFVYCNIDNKIIKCTCLSELHKDRNYYNEDLGSFFCAKVKIITIYYIYKNIIYEYIQIKLFNKLIKIGEIIEDLIGNTCFFKTFIGAFIKNNKLNGIEYYTNRKGFIYKFLYDNIKLRINGLIKTFNIYDNEGTCTHLLHYTKRFIIYENYNDLFKYHICYNNIKMKNGKSPFHQIIHCNVKNLKIFKIYKYNGNIGGIYEHRNDNNEITYLNEYNKNVLKEDFRFNDINPPFSKPLKKFCIELIDYYKKNINNYNELIESCLKKKKEMYNNLLLNCNLEIINSI